MADLPCHDECKYHGFLCLVEWCRHPDNLGPIEPTRRAVLEEAGGRCRYKVAWEAKVMPGMEPPWPMPVNLQELFPVTSAERISYPQGTKVHKS